MNQEVIPPFYPILDAGQLAARGVGLSELAAKLKAAGAGLVQYRDKTGSPADILRATAILRGIRDVSDLRYEFQLAMANRAVGGVETVFVMTGDQYALTSSSLIRQVVALGGDVAQLRAVLPELVIERLKAMHPHDVRSHVMCPEGP